LSLAAAAADEPYALTLLSDGDDLCGPAGDCPTAVQSAMAGS